MGLGEYFIIRLELNSTCSPEREGVHFFKEPPGVPAHRVVDDNVTFGRVYQIAISGSMQSTTDVHVPSRYDSTMFWITVCRGDTRYGRQHVLYAANEEVPKGEMAPDTRVHTTHTTAGWQHFSASHETPTAEATDASGGHPCATRQPYTQYIAHSEERGVVH